MYRALILPIYQLPAITLKYLLSNCYCLISLPFLHIVESMQFIYFSVWFFLDIFVYFLVTFLYDKQFGTMLCHLLIYSVKSEAKWIKIISNECLYIWLRSDNAGITVFCMYVLQTIRSSVSWRRGCTLWMEAAPSWNVSQNHYRPRLHGPIRGIRKTHGRRWERGEAGWGRYVGLLWERRMQTALIRDDKCVSLFKLMTFILSLLSVYSLLMLDAFIVCVCVFTGSSRWPCFADWARSIAETSRA